METKELICVNCPKGCKVSVTLEGTEIIDIKGYSCEKGKQYAGQETIRPMRILTSTVKVEGGTFRVIPVITSKEIPLDLMEQAMTEIRKVVVKAPIRVDTVVISNLLDTGADVVTARSMNCQ